MGAGGLLIQAFWVAESQSTTDVSRPFAAPSRRSGAQDTAVKWIGRVYRIQLGAHSPRAGRVLHQQQGRIDARRRIAHRRRRCAWDVLYKSVSPSRSLHQLFHSLVGVLFASRPRAVCSLATKRRKRVRRFELHTASALTRPPSASLATARKHAQRGAVFNTFGCCALLHNTHIVL